MATGRIVVTTGPERGRVFEIEEELVHVGRAVENQIVLDDASLEEHQASILNKNGRFAIYRPEDAVVNVDGNDIPAEQWVWLPTDARLQFGMRTTCHFTYEKTLEESSNKTTGPATSEKTSGQSAQMEEGGQKKTAKFRASNSDTSDQSGDGETLRAKPKSKLPKLQPTPVADEGKSEGKAPADKQKKKKKRKRQTARFITDQGNPLVELGADGQLPELELDEELNAKQKSDKPKQSSPALMYFILSTSFLSTLAMLFADPSAPQSGPLSKQDAREDIKVFYGSVDKESGELKPFQKKLRAAQLARSRGDFAEERRLYLSVLHQLNAEDRDQNVGVTGSLTRDEDLKILIGVLVSRP